MIVNESQQTKKQRVNDNASTQNEVEASVIIGKIGSMNCAPVYLTLCKYKKYFLYELY